MEDQNQVQDPQNETPDIGSWLSSLPDASPPDTPTPPEWLPQSSTPPEWMPAPPPQNAAAMPQGLAGLFGGNTYNQGIDYGYTPFGEGLGDNARYGDASKNWFVGQDPSSLLIPAFTGGGGAIGAGLRGAFGMIGQERAKRGQDMPTPQEFTKQAREGTLTRVFPQTDPKTGDVYRVYQYGDERFGAPRYTKEQVYAAPKPTEAKSSGGGTGTGQTPPKPTETAQEAAARAAFKVPAGGSLTSLKENDGL